MATGPAAHMAADRDMDDRERLTAALWKLIGGERDDDARFDVGDLGPLQRPSELADAILAALPSGDGTTAVTLSEAEAAALDTERLARALVRWAGMYPEVIDAPVAAAAIAREYVALASSPEDLHIDLAAWVEANMVNGDGALILEPFQRDMLARMTRGGRVPRSALGVLKMWALLNGYDVIEASRDQAEVLYREATALVRGDKRV